MREVKLTTHSADATRELGAELGRAILDLAATDNLHAPLVVNLSGELGAGKTTFVSGLLRAMGVSGPIRSPTYTLIEPYELGELGAQIVYHLDLYRLGNARDLEMLALRDLLQPGAVLLVEWAERGEGALPPPDLSVSLGYPAAQVDNAATQRQVAIRSSSPRGDLLMNKLVHALAKLSPDKASLSP